MDDSAGTQQQLNKQVPFPSPPPQFQPGKENSTGEKHVPMKGPSVSRGS